MSLSLSLPLFLLRLVYEMDKQNGLFRNEIFISNTFIILFPSLNINFSNVWMSKGRIRRIVLARIIDFHEIQLDHHRKSFPRPSPLRGVTIDRFRTNLATTTSQTL
jgi:hypothetical protein